MDCPQFSKKLIELRSHNGLSQSEVAHRIGAPVSSYKDLEHRGYCRHLVKYLVPLAKVYGISVASLLGKQPSYDIIELCIKIKSTADLIIETANN